DFVCVFFFQAEDGIRDFHVTGVQTCALPIYSPKEDIMKTDKPWDNRKYLEVEYEGKQRSTNDIAREHGVYPNTIRRALIRHGFRSEERRVGKECRSRWATEHQKRKEYEIR